MKITRKLTAAFLCSLILFTGCSGDDEETLPDGTLEDTSGLSLILEWDTGSTATAATEDADLELSIYKGETLVVNSDYWTSFEEVELSGLLADGDYTVEVYLWDTSKQCDFTLYVQGINSSDPVYEYTGTFYTSDGSGASYPELITISKSGDTYTIYQ